MLKNKTALFYLLSGFLLSVAGGLTGYFSFRHLWRGVEQSKNALTDLAPVVITSTSQILHEVRLPTSVFNPAPKADYWPSCIFLTSVLVALAGIIILGYGVYKGCKKKSNTNRENKSIGSVFYVIMGTFLCAIGGFYAFYTFSCLVLFSALRVGGARADLHSELTGLDYEALYGLAFLAANLVLLVGLSLLAYSLLRALYRFLYRRYKSKKTPCC